MDLTGNAKTIFDLQDVNLSLNKFWSFFWIESFLTQNRDLYMASLGVDTLSTNIVLDETVDICVKKVFKALNTLVKGVSWITKFGYQGIIFFVQK